MSTDDLIARLAADPRPRPPVASALGPWVAAAGLGSLGLLVAGWGLREGLGAALAEPLVAPKALIPALAAVAGLLGALRLSRPEGRARGSGTALVALLLAGAALVASALAATPRPLWGEALRGETLASCLMSIPALAALPVAAALVVLGRGASTRPRLSGLLAGLGGGGLAAALYALHCPEDSPLFYVTWYGAGILVAGAAGALAGPRLLRW